MALPIKRLPSHLIPVLFKTGVRIHSAFLQCIVSKTGITQPAYAIVVGIKVQKSAVKRNRMKRIIRAALIHILPTLPHPIQCIVVVKKDCSTKHTSNMILELEPLKSL
jgi:ribonuclease P protein component